MLQPTTRVWPLSCDPARSIPFDCDSPHAVPKVWGIQSGPEVQYIRVYSYGMNSLILLLPTRIGDNLGMVSVPPLQIGDKFTKLPVI